ncbi:MAG: cell wall hydrolase [Desulfobulbus sp.]|jgi:N-acetylmuramoyl-L-alanine amidase|uniref:cell wall hydrolase n=1 Tax=Desulfobulbus sp. TaxID=895 RepID=UPI0028434D93|nr:cell wall hydrolase [Desulfobulbus sp.]MDR2549091.1 cell wall hydrolase [Desulfobulbus sp.]
MPIGFVESLFWLSLNIYHESRGEPEIGQLAVAHVTLNRAMEENKSLADVILAPNQFSWTFQKKSYAPLEINPLQESLRMALKAMTTPDFTKGSTFYHHIDVAPGWAAGKAYIGRYGSHKFYRQGDTPISAAAY